MRSIPATLLASLPLLTGCPPGADETGGTATSSATSSSTSMPATASTEVVTGGTGSEVTSVTTGEPTTGTSTADTGSTGDTGDSTTGPDTTTGDACQFAAASPLYYTGNASYAWSDPVDELCIVAVSEATPDGLQLRMDCPVHAMQNAGEQVEITLQSGPMPGTTPQVGDELHVFYQLGGDAVPRPGLLFLHSKDRLLYFAVNGFFVFQGDVNNANKYTLPLNVNLVPGSCPLVDNPDWTGRATGFVCEREAPALMEFVGDGPPVLLGEGMTAEIAAGDLLYGVDVRVAREGENCGELATKQNQTAAGALMTP